MANTPSFEKIAGLYVQMVSKEKIAKAAAERLVRAQEEYRVVAESFRLIKAAYDEAVSKTRGEA